MKNLYLIPILFLLFIVGCEEDNIDTDRHGSLSGLIVDGETYQPLQGVLVATSPASSSAITGNNGEFSFNKISEGEVTVTAKKKDYLTNSVLVYVYEEELTQMNIVLTKDEKDYGSVTIYDPVPGNGAVDQLSSFTMEWTVDQTKSDITLYYDVYLFESNSSTQQTVGQSLTVKEVVVDDLDDNTTYYWYVVAKYDGNIVAYSPTWSFKTGDNPEN